MINIKFKSAYGVIDMGGGGHPIYKVTDCDGITLPSLTRNTEQYYDEPGQRIIYEQAEARTITLSIDVLNYGGASRRLRNMSKILSVPGTLIIELPERARAIAARCTSFEIGTRNRTYYRTVVQLVCDDPYFTDKQSTSISVYEVNSLLKSPFTLPMMFSSRALSVDIKNIGDIKTEPVIYLYGGVSINNPAADNTITVKNNTTGQSVKITDCPEEGETIVVDIPNRRIYNSNSPLVPLYCISEDTFLSDFYLAEGVNTISAETSTQREIAVVMEYSNKYTEAII